MKKLFALLLTVVMMASMMVPAMAAYEAAVLPTVTIDHSLTLTQDTQLDYDITYSFEVKEGDGPFVVNSETNGVSNPGNAVTGVPTIASITYNQNSDNFSADKLTGTRKLTVDWKNVKIYQPGIYRWKVTQTVTEKAPDTATCKDTFYLYAYVTDNNGALSAQVWMSLSDTYTSEKADELPEKYPATTVDLTIVKTVAGNQGSKEQYFPFTVTLTAPNAGDVTNTPFAYTLTTPNTTYDLSVPKTAYNNAVPEQPKEVTITNGVGSFVIWLKHGQSVTINDMIYGTSYSIVEAGNAGYTSVEAEVTDGHNKGFSYNASTYTAADDMLEENATVTFTNTKTTEVPTGISLEAGVAFFGIVLAMGMMMLMFVGKRKEQN